MQKLPAILVTIAALSAFSANIDPKYARTLTLYHVNERTQSASPVNMNTADLNGDIYFDLRSRGLPLECGIWRNQSFWSRLDCVNPEVANVSNLAITKLMLEVDTRWANYENCNVDPVTSVYSCTFDHGCPDNCTALTAKGRHACDYGQGCAWDEADSRCEVHGCFNNTNRDDCVNGYGSCVWDSTSSKCEDKPGPPNVCDRSKVGFLDLTTVDWGRHDAHEKPTKVGLWHANALTKTYGLWYSTQAEGECRPNDASQSFCSWRVSSVVKKISKACSDDAINAAIVEGDKNAPWGARCFDKCSAADQKNTTSQCWILCFYSNVLGKGNSQYMNHSSPGFGIPVSDLQAAWDKPFLPVAKGGCPDISMEESIVV